MVEKMNYSMRSLHDVFLQSAKQAFHHSMALRGEVLLRLDHTTLVFAPRPDFLLFSFCSRGIPVLRNSTMVPGNSFRAPAGSAPGAGKFFPGAVVQFLCAGVEFPGAVVEFLGTR